MVSRLLIKEAGLPSELSWGHCRAMREEIARFLVYVDDIVASGPEKWVTVVLRKISEIWACKMTGILIPKAK